jgi:hypothetical protein
LRQSENRFGDIPLEDGDLVFRKGRGAKSWAVLRADAEGIYSHIGIVVRQDSVFQVIHITPGERKNGEAVDRIKMEPLDEFWHSERAKHGAVYRLIGDSSRRIAAQHAIRLLQKGLLFDHDYELADTTTMYCTQLVWYVYTLAGKDISGGKRSLINAPLYSGTYIFPSDIYTNNELSLIYKF